jgi:hypothetical protein
MEIKIAGTIVDACSVVWRPEILLTPFFQDSEK